MQSVRLKLMFWQFPSSPPFSSGSRLLRRASRVGHASGRTLNLGRGLGFVLSVVALPRALMPMTTMAGKLLHLVTMVAQVCGKLSPHVFWIC